jgi:hypothetical protein
MRQWFLCTRNKYKDEIIVLRVYALWLVIYQHPLTSAMLCYALLKGLLFRVKGSKEIGRSNLLLNLNGGWGGGGLVVGRR